jgi:hypothetical protein
MEVEIKVEEVPTTVVNRKWKQYTVKVGDTIIGLLEKWKNTRTEKHPWKAFKGVGKACTFLKSFYPEEGGKDAAILAVVHAAGLCDCGGEH